MYGYNLNGSLLFSSEKIKDLEDSYLGTADENLVYSKQGLPYWDDIGKKFELKILPIIEDKKTENFLTTQINQI